MYEMFACESIEQRNPDRVVPCCQRRGDRRKLIGTDFTTQEVNAILKELSHLPRLKKLQFGLDNWEISDQGDSWHIKLKYPVKQYLEELDNVLILESTPDSNQ